MALQADPDLRELRELAEQEPRQVQGVQTEARHYSALRRVMLAFWSDPRGRPLSPLLGLGLTGLDTQSICVECQDQEHSGESGA